MVASPISKLGNLPAASAAARGEIITLKIGPNAHIYQVHKDFLTHYSEYFKKALSGPYQEAEDRNIPLLDIGRPTFDNFLDWLYHQKLPESIGAWAKMPEDEECEESWRRACLTMVQLYIFADRFQVSGLQANVKSEMSNYMDSYEIPPSVKAISHAYDNLPEEDPAMKLLVDAWVDHVTPSSLNENILAELPSTLLARLLLQTATTKRSLAERLGEKISIEAQRQLSSEKKHRILPWMRDES